MHGSLKGPMPSNTTQRRSGSGKRPERDSSSGDTPSTTPAASTADDAAAEVETASSEGAGEIPASPATKVTPAAKATPAAKTTSGSKTGAATRSPGTKATPGRGGSGGKGPTRKGAGKGGGRGRQPVKVVKAGLPWGNITLGGIVVVVALSIIGYGVWYSWDASKPFGERRSQQIDGAVNYRAKDVKWLTQNHVNGKLKYQTSPPVGGNHNGTWENCSGDVYAKQIPNEHAVHSLEHGAVWITYRPGLPQSQIDTLAKKVKGKDYMLMSPYPGLDKPISVQAWGFQLKVESASDKRIDEFITQFRVNASVESGAACSNGVTITGDTPKDTSATDSSGMNSGG